MGYAKQGYAKRGARKRNTQPKAQVIPAPASGEPIAQTSKNRRGGASTTPHEIALLKPRFALGQNAR
jgi:hypothetical protein